jgi:hypothetical protein
VGQSVRGATGTHRNGSVGLVPRGSIRRCCRGGRNRFAGELHGMGTHACPRGGGLVTFGRGAAPVAIVQKLDAVD